MCIFKISRVDKITKELEERKRRAQMYGDDRLHIISERKSELEKMKHEAAKVSKDDKREWERMLQAYKEKENALRRIEKEKYFWGEAYNWLKRISEYVLWLKEMEEYGPIVRHINLKTIKAVFKGLNVESINKLKKIDNILQKAYDNARDSRNYIDRVDYENQKLQEQQDIERDLTSRLSMEDFQKEVEDAYLKQQKIAQPEAIEDSPSTIVEDDENKKIN